MSEEALLEEIRDLLVEIRGILKGQPLSAENQASDNEQAPSKRKEKLWGQHLEEKNPKNDYEIIALVVDHLTNSEKKSVSKEEIIGFIRENPDRINNAEETKLLKAISNTKSMDNYKYIEFVDEKNDKSYRLSIKGKQLVRKLPGRPENAKSKKPGKKKMQ